MSTQSFQSAYKRAVATALIVSASFGVSAEVLTVTSSADGVPVDDGELTLREALAEAAAGDLIRFGRSLRSATIELEQGALTIDRPLEIVGFRGNQRVRIDARRESPVFQITPSSRDVTLSGLVITGGEGGAVQQSGPTQLTIVDSVIDDNSGRFGGGLSIVAGNVTLINTPLQRNSASGSGGGAWLDPGSLTLINSPVRNNTAQVSGGGFASGSSFGGSLKAINSAFDNNVAETGAGGAIATSNNRFTVTLLNSPLRFNRASQGGALSSRSGTNTTLINSDVRENSALGNGGGFDLVNVFGLELYNVNVFRNSAGGDGGGVSGRNLPLLLDETRILRNGASSGGGLFGAITVEAIDSAVRRNIPDDCQPDDICP